MSDEVEDTFEDRKHCPKCKVAGDVTASLPAPPTLPKGTVIKTIYCRNERCNWFDTPWMVQVNPDGSVPAPKDHTKQPKLYQGFEGHTEMANSIMAAMENDRLASMEKNAEIRRRL